MPEGTKDQGSEFTHGINNLASKFGYYRNKASTTFGDEGEPYAKKRDELYGQLVDSTAEELAQQTGNEKRKDVLRSASGTILRECGRWFNETDFAIDVFLKTIEIMKSSSSKNLQQ